jgi:hypothetical protein
MTGFSTVKYMREIVTAVALMFTLVYGDAVRKDEDILPRAYLFLNINKLFLFISSLSIILCHYFTLLRYCT